MSAMLRSIGRCCRVASLLGCIAQLVAGQPVDAQSPQSLIPTQTPVFETEVLVTAERGAEPRDETSSATAVLKRADLEKLPGNSLPALMNSLPGFHVLFGSDFAGTPMIQSRGFFGGGEAEYVQLLIDGVPAADAEAGLADWRRVRAWNIDRIEARRGPSSSLYGDTALGGVIQVITRRDVPRGGIAVGGGSSGAFELDAGMSRLAGKTIATFTGTASRSDGFRSHAAMREGALSAAVESSWSAQRLAIRAGAEGRRQDEPGPRSLIELQTDRFGSDPMFGGDGEASMRGRASVEYGYAGQALLLNVMTHAAARETDRTRTLLLAPGFGSPSHRALTTATAGATVRVEHRGIVLNGATATRVGAEILRDAVSSGYGDTREEASNARLDGSRARIGVYVSEVWSPTGRLRVSGGFRYDRIEDAFESYAPSHPVHDAWSPRLGLTYRLFDDAQNATTVFIETARAFKAPTLDQLFDSRLVPDFAGGTFVISNPALRPQRASMLEGGVRHTVGASRVEVIAYRMRVDDEIDFDPMTFTYGNIGNTYHSGVEAEVQWRHYPRVTPSLVYGWTVVAPVGVSAQERQLKNIPRHLLKPTLMMQLPGGVSATIAYTRSAGGFLDDDNLFPLNDVSSVDVRIGRIFRRVIATVDLLNLTDDDFEEVGFALPNLEGATTPFYFPGRGLGARAGVQVRF